jgi:Na+/proline symporter
LDWIIIISFFAFILLIGLWSSRRAGNNVVEYFLSGRNMPWWLLGVSMVATTFSADTPNLVTDIVRQNGVAGNWVWWAFLLTGMTTVFLYAGLWRRSGIGTDLEFYEMRYSGKEALFLRAFRALYLGVFFNIMIMATVLLAGVKISGILLDLNKFETLALVAFITLSYSVLGGLRGVVITDFFQFLLSMGGMIAAAIYIVNMPEIDGLNALVQHELVKGKMDLIPDFTDPNIYVPLFLIPLAVQWWSVWYPGAEPGGGGYVAQRILSAKTEHDAIRATLLFNIAHYALRPWPWILIALASLIIFPEVQDLEMAFPDLDPKIIRDDLAFPAMISLLPTGLLGLMIAALMAALMSTISTHLNWGASYIVCDFYKRFLHPAASEKQQVKAGRISTAVLMLLASAFVLYLENALQAFNILLQIGAGTGLLFLLRWFWWRINAYSEISAMVVSFIVALYFEIIYIGNLEHWQRMLIGIGITSLAWILITFITRPTEVKVLKKFYHRIHPYSFGWKPFAKEELQPTHHKLGKDIFAVFVGSVMVYGFLLGFGWSIYAQWTPAVIALTLAIICSIYLWNRLKTFDD